MMSNFSWIHSWIWKGFTVDWLSFKAARKWKIQWTQWALFCIWQILPCEIRFGNDWNLENNMSHFYNDFQLFKKYKDLVFLIFSVYPCYPNFIIFALKGLFKREVFIWNQNAYMTFFEMIQHVTSFERNCRFCVIKNQEKKQLI